MSDLVVTVPKHFWFNWIDEGDSVGDPPTGEEWGFFLGGPRPPGNPGDRLYVVAHGRLRGFAPITSILETARGWAICRRAGAEAVTIAGEISGFRGWRHRWWDRSVEIAFPTWKTEGVKATTREDRYTLDRLLREVT